MAADADGAYEARPIACAACAAKQMAADADGPNAAPGRWWNVFRTRG